MPDDDLGSKLQETRDRYVVIKHLMKIGLYPDDIALQVKPEKPAQVLKAASLDDVVEISPGVPLLRREYDVLVEFCQQCNLKPAEEIQHLYENLCITVANGHVIGLNPALNPSYENLRYIPESIGALENLRKLILSDSQISELPESFCNLKNLRELYMAVNKIVALPNSFGSLTNLVELDLAVNSLTYLPDSFTKLKKLKNLYLEDNQFRLFPEQILQLRNLGVVTLHNNYFSDVPPLYQLSKLTWISIPKHMDTHKVQRNSTTTVDDFYLRLPELFL